MAKLFAELLADLFRALVTGLLNDAIAKAGAWLDKNIRGRRTKIIVGLLLGLAAFFLFPVILGILGL